MDLAVAQRLRAERLAILKRHRTDGTTPTERERRELEHVGALLHAHRERLSEALRRRGPLEVARELAERGRARGGAASGFGIGSTFR